MKKINLRWLGCVLVTAWMTGAWAQGPVIHSVSDVTQTRATLSATFASGSVADGFQFKYGSLPEMNDFDRSLLAEQSDPLAFVQGAKAWRWREAKQWAESYYGLSAGEQSVLSTTVTLTQATVISFDWMVDTEEGKASLQFWVDGTLPSAEFKVTGLMDDFQTKTYLLSAGEHQLSWVFVKNAETNIGADMGMIRNICVRNTTPGAWLLRSASGETLRLTGLYPSERYVYRAYSVVDGDTLFSSLGQFQTKDLVAHTLNLSAVTQRTATLVGRMDPGDAEVTRVVEYSVYNAGELKTVEFSDNDYTVVLQDLMPGTRYQARAYMRPAFTSDLEPRWPESKATSSSLTFETKGVAAYLQPVEQLRQASVTLRGKVESGDAVVTDKGFLWKVGTSDTWTTVSLTEASDDLSLTLRRLRPDTEYHYRTYVKAQGALTAYSPVDTFTTLGVQAHTPELVGVTQHTATVRAWVESGDATIYTRGLQFRKANGTWTDYEDVGVDTIYERCFPDLNLVSDYEVRTYIQPQGCDVIYSESLTFKTRNITVYVDSVMPVHSRKVVLHAHASVGDHALGEWRVQLYNDRKELVRQFYVEPTDTLLTQEVDSLIPGQRYFFRVGMANGLVLAYGPVRVRQYPSSSFPYLRVADLPEDHQALLASDSDPITVTHDGLEKGTNCLYTNDASNYGYLLKTTFTLRQASTLTFDWGVKGYTTYSNKTYSSKVWSYIGAHRYEIVANSNTSMNVASVSISLPAGTHSLQWYFTGYGTNYEAQIGNMRITGTTVGDLRDEPCVFTTPLPFKNVSVADVTQTRASLHAVWADLGETPVRQGFAYWPTAASDTLYQRYQEIPCEFYTDSMNVQLSGLRPDFGYTMCAYCQLGDSTYYSDTLSFKTRPVKVAIKINDVTQTRASLHAVWADLGETPVRQGFACWPTSASDTLYQRYQEIPCEFRADSMDLQLSNLYPYFGYTVCAYCQLGDSTYYSQPVRFTTRNVWINVVYRDITPTTAKMEVAVEPGDAEMNDLQYVITPWEQWFDATYAPCLPVNTLVGLVPSERYYPMFRWETNGKLCYFLMDEEDWILMTGSVNLQIEYPDVQETSVRMHVEVQAGDAVVENLTCRLNGRTYSVGTEDVLFTELQPGTTYRPSFSWTVGGVSYSYTAPPFTTAAVTVDWAAEAVTWQTTALARLTVHVGNATLVEKGFCVDEIYRSAESDSLYLTGLQPATSYTVYPYVATVEGGVVLGPARTVVTLPVRAESAAATQISNRSACLNGRVECDTYSGAEIGFEWRGMSGWESDPIFTPGTLTADGTLSLGLLPGMLEPNTDYEFRAVVHYGGRTYAGAWKNFRTELEYVLYPASVYTLYRTDRATNSIVFCGYYVQGSEPVVSCGYEYWSSAESASERLLAPAQVVRVETGTDMSYVLDASFLGDGMYQLRAYVQTETATYYGQTLAFHVGADAIGRVAIDPSVGCWGGRGHLLLTGAVGLDYQVVDMSGRCVSVGRAVRNEERLPLAAGLYVVRLSSGHIYKVWVH